MTDSGAGTTRRTSQALMLSLITLGLGACARLSTPQAGSGGASRPLRPLLANGVARTPPMGWSSWNYFGCEGLNEQVIRETADAMVQGPDSLKDAGYTYVNIDDCWMKTPSGQARPRNPDGTLSPDPTRFPGGMQALADYVHGRGLKIGLYSSPGLATCQKGGGSQGYEQIDAQQYARWGIDYLKYDRCGIPVDATLRNRFVLMRDALQKSSPNRPIVYSINPDTQDGQSWADVANLWRVTVDIKPFWDKVEGSPTENNYPRKHGVLGVLDRAAEVASVAGPGQWTDADMLEVGVRKAGFSGLTNEEARSHFSLWAMLSSPLIAGNDLRNMTPETRAILTNREVIDVDQDAAGTPAVRVRDDGDLEVWSKTLSGEGTRAVVLLNRSSSNAQIGVRWSELGLAWGEADLRDLWRHQDLGPVENTYSASVPPHGVVMLRVKGADNNGRYEAEAGVNTPEDKDVVSCGRCTGGALVRSIGRGTTLQFNDLYVRQSGRYQLRVAYTTRENRSASVSVNGAPGVSTFFPGTGGAFLPRTATVPVDLRAGLNTVQFSNDRRWAPNIDNVTVLPGN